MSTTIIKVVNNKQLKQFIDYPHELYDEDPNYVPELHIAVKELLSEKKNPYFKHSKANYYLAYKNGKCVGRISATVNNHYNQYHQSNVGFFGFYDCENDPEASKALLDAAIEYCKLSSVEAILGPTNLTTNDTAGVLVEGYDSPPVVQMTYNKPYYKELLEAEGFGKEMDLFAYKIETKKVNKKALRLSERFQERLSDKGITFRNVNMKDFQKEVDQIREIYKSAWEKNWGFVPPTNDEFDFIAEGLKMVINPEYVYIAEDGDRMVGFAVGLPDINEILIRIKKGRLFPTGLFKLLFGKNKTKNLRIVLLGVVDEYRKMGIEAVFFANFINAAIDNNIGFGEASWVLENNKMMVQGAENLNGERYKTYRIYSKKI